jgi:predicted O-linked N-acetylglucosamine transferase (SPINDLY family)
MEHHRGGRLGEAERLYLSVPEQDPNHAKACFLAGVIAMQADRPDVAVERFARAVSLSPDNAAFLSNLGEAYRRNGQLPYALDALLRAVRLQPNLAEASFNLGVLLEQRGDLAAALACFERAAELKPELPTIDGRLASLRDRLGEGRKAGSGKGGDAPIDRDSADLLVQLANTLSRQGRNEDAVRLFQRAVELRPRAVDLLTNLGLALSSLNRMEEATASLRRALAIRPDVPETLCNLGNSLLYCGLHEEGIAAYRRALAVEPKPEFHSSMLFFLPFCPGYDSNAIREETRRYGEALKTRLNQAPAPHPNHRDPERRLRVGYINGHFRDHCQALFLSPLLTAHDRGAFEIFCYSGTINPDKWTAKFRSLVDGWRSIGDITDEAAALQIREDRIDVLVDLGMHMDCGRLPILARKPAPVQICWLAYPGTTGVEAVDYRVTDPYLDPPGQDDSVYSERSMRLEDTFWCYAPLMSPVPEVAPLPAATEGRVTFGCLNNFLKVNAEVLSVWARVLREVKSSRLVLLIPQGEARHRIRQELEKHGVDRSRLDLIDRLPRAEYMAQYSRIDVALDTFPYNGHTTSLDAWWMGVPVVTLVGKTVVGRAGLSQAMNLGLQELVAHSPDEFVSIAVGLSKDLVRLSELRAGLRARMQRSPLMDAPRFARNMEAQYRSAWQRWCRGDQFTGSASP